MCVSPPNKKLGRIEKAIHAIKPTVEGTRLDIQGRIERPPLESTSGNQKLWQNARTWPPINSESISNRQQRAEGQMEIGLANIAQLSMGWEPLVMEPMPSMSMWSKTNYQNVRASRMPADDAPLAADLKALAHMVENSTGQPSMPVMSSNFDLQNRQVRLHASASRDIITSVRWHKLS